MTLIDPAGPEIYIGDAAQAFTSAASMASHTASEWLVEAAKADRNGDHAFRDRCLSEAERKTADAEWYLQRAALFALPLTYPKIEAHAQLEAAE